MPTLVFGHRLKKLPPIPRYALKHPDNRSRHASGQHPGRQVAQVEVDQQIVSRQQALLINPLDRKTLKLPRLEVVLIECCRPQY